MLRTINMDNKSQSICSKNQYSKIEETSAHLFRHWSIIFVQVRQHTVNLGYQGWWLLVKNVR